jgi:hypothetical protein
MSDLVIDEEWPEGFFEEVVGGWKGEPLERPDQGWFEATRTREFTNRQWDGESH